ncbi:MAG: PAS domain S-box protein [Desertifilum sp. SIO1I2]|nr:PAS domain S-box protein [Desertifilum sp. SIO1I2]
MHSTETFTQPAMANFQADNPSEGNKVHQAFTSHREPEIEPPARISPLLAAFAQATQLVLGSPATREALQSALAMLGEAIAVNCCYLLRLYPDAIPGDWQAQVETAWFGGENATSAIAPYPVNAQWYATLAAHQPIKGFLPDFSLLHRSWWERRNVCSFIWFPVFFKDNLWGILGFEDCQSQRRWTTEEETLLGSFAITLGAAIANAQLTLTLQQNESRLQRISVNLPGVIFQSQRYDNDSCRMCYISPTCRELFELEPEVIQARNEVLLELIHQGDREDHDRRLTHSMQTLEPFYWEGRIVTPSGRLKWIQCASRPERQSDRSVLWDGVVLEITERKQSEEALRLSEARNRALIEATPDLMFRIRADGTYLDAKADKAYQIILPPKKIIGKNLFDVLPREAAEERMANIQRALATGQTQLYEYQLFIQGQWRDYEGRIVVSGADEVLAIVRDISDRKQVEKQLKEREAQYRSIFEATTDGIIISDPETGQVIETNPVCCAMHGYTYEEFIGLYPQAFIHPDHFHLFYEYRQALQTGGQFYRRTVDLRKDGTPFPVEVRGIQFEYNGKPHLLAILRDITEQVRSERLQQEQEVQYRSIFEASRDALFVNELDGTLVEVNPAACEIFGYPYDELIKLKPETYIHPDYHHLLDEYFATIQAGGEYRTQAIDIRKDGSLFHVDVLGTRFIYKGKPHILGVIRDITAQVQAQQALQESEEKFATAFRSSPYPCTISLLENARFIEVNDRFLEVTGYCLEEVIGRTAFELSIWDDPTDRAYLVEALQATGAVRDRELTLLTKQGERRTVLFSAEMIVLGGQQCWLCVVNDITERKQAEAQLQIAAQRDRLFAKITSQIHQSLKLDCIFDTTVREVRQFLGADRVYIAHIDAQGTYGEVVAESVDSAWISLYGQTTSNTDYLNEIRALFTQHQVRAIDDVTQIEAPPNIAQHYADYQVKSTISVPVWLGDEVFGVLVAHQCSHPRHWEAMHKDLLEALSTQVAIAIKQAQLTAGLERTVAERTAQLQEKYAELLKLNQLKDIFLHAVSHDLRTPVTGWLLVLQNLLKVADNKPDSPPSIPIPRSVLERMVQSSHAQLHLINSLLETAASEIRGIVLFPKPTQLNEVIQGLAADLEPLIIKHQAFLVQNLPENLPVVDVDCPQLRRVFENLIGNALKHNPPGIKIEIGAEVIVAESSVIRFTITDNGVGMSPEDCATIFQLYVRGQTSRHSPGLGLGLYLCRQIITAHGGEIGVDSTLGIGTTFWFTIPIEGKAQ